MNKKYPTNILNKKSLICACIAMIFFINSYAYSEETVVLKGNFDANKAIKLLYGNFDPKTQTAHWQIDKEKNVMGSEIIKNFGSPTSLVVSVLDSIRYKENGIDKYFIITTAKSDNGDTDYTCHACSFILGGAIFKRNNQVWELEANNRLIKNAGSYGEMGDAYNLLKIGSDKFGLEFHTFDCHQGCYIGAYVISAVDRSIEEIFFLMEVINQERRVFDASWDLVENTNKDYYDLHVKRCGKDYDPNDGSIISVNNDELYVFSDRKYILKSKVNNDSYCSLKGSDKELNLVYRTLMSRLSPSEKATLKKEEIGWIKEKEDACKYESDREYCLSKFTRNRISQLKKYRKPKLYKVSPSIFRKIKNKS